MEPRIVVTSRLTKEKIRRRAYQIYMKRGRRPGRELNDWLQAEYELKNVPVESKNVSLSHSHVGGDALRT
jgi:hypothetical protein